MCGVVGIRRFDGSRVDPRLLATMTGRLRHRGPDGQGQWIDDRGAIGLGHTRLSIIDVAGSPQPMSTPDGRYHLAYNGEIFNYRRLRDTLPYPFRTAGDTEVLLAGLVRHGTSFLHQVRGQFAFALVDSWTGSLLLGRDPLGILPLHYAARPAAVVFGSEIKALLPALDTVAVDTDSLDSFLAHNSVHAPYTLFAGVRKVLPGHVVHVSAAGRVTTQRYWRPPAPGDELQVSAAEALELVEQSLRRAVRSALVADVPVGAYLSGGLDSSLITAIMRDLEPGARIETFSAGFGDRRFDELPHARAVAGLLGTEHHEVEVRAADFLTLWPELTWQRDAPLSQPADVAVYQLARSARPHVKVVLSGEGSDELFAGYRKYRFARLVRGTDLVPFLPARVARLLEPRLPATAAPAAVVLRAVSVRGELDRLDSWFAPFSLRERSLLLGDARTDRPLPVAHLRGDVVRRMLTHDLLGWLPDNLLERGDRMSMAASVELRPPFLDLDLVALAFRLPSAVKLRQGTSKWVVKEVARRYLPDSIVDRTKVGFRVPLDDWFRSGLRPMARELLLASDSFAAQVFDRREVATLLDRHERASGNEEKRLWTLLSLEVWHRRYFGH